MAQGKKKRSGPAGAPASDLEDLLAVKNDIETFPFFLRPNTKAEDRLGDEQQHQRANAAPDQGRGYTLALKPKLRQAARAAVRRSVCRRPRPERQHTGQQRTDDPADAMN